MRAEDFQEFSSLLDGAYELIGKGQQKIISPNAKAMFFAALSNYPLPAVRAALHAHCIDPDRGSFVPVPADLIRQIEGAAGGDTRPGAEEAWAIALTSRDESNTVVWTAESAQAFAICQPVLAVGDEVGARMAFKEAYNRLVQEARKAGEPVQWSASLGWDQTKRTAALTRAKAANLLPAPTVAALLPAPEGATATPDEKAHQQIAAIRKMLAESEKERNRRRDMLEYERWLDDLIFRQLTNERVEQYLAQASAA